MLSTPKNSYGYIWSDWLYDYDKDTFMVDVYNDCKRIDECGDITQKAAWLTMLRDKVQHSKKPWVEGIIDFIDFESASISSGKAPLDILEDNVEEYQVMAIIDGAYHHGAFRGLCRTASGAEWIGFMGEWCAAALHQGLKGMRMGKPVSEWELPSLGEAWCKGAAIWSLVCMYMINDQAGDNPDNDQIIARVHTVIAAHHMAGFCWLKYRGSHPHRWFNPNIRGVAPCQQAIRRFGEKHAYPTIMIDIMCRAADHVNQWINPPANPIHLTRTRGLLIWDHTPRLKARLEQVCEELKEVTGDMTPSEEVEVKWRLSVWLSTITTTWRGRGDLNDGLLEIALTGGLTGVLRESRPHVTLEFVDRAMDWSKRRAHHLPLEQQQTVLLAARAALEIRGRIPGAVKGGYSSAGFGRTRFVDGVWELSHMLGSLVSPYRLKHIPTELKSLEMKFFNELKGYRQVQGVDIPFGGDEGSRCPLCLPGSIFTALVDNQIPTAVLQCGTWGSLLYNNLGLGLPNDVSLGCVKHEGNAVAATSQPCKYNDVMMTSPCPLADDSNDLEGEKA